MKASRYSRPDLKLLAELGSLSTQVKVKVCCQLGYRNLPNLMSSKSFGTFCQSKINQSDSLNPLPVPGQTSETRTETEAAVGTRLDPRGIDSRNWKSKVV